MRSTALVSTNISFKCPEMIRENRKLIKVCLLPDLIPRTALLALKGAMTGVEKGREVMITWLSLPFAFDVNERGPTSFLHFTSTYGCEYRTVKLCDAKYITAFEHKCYRKILRVPWTQKRTNADTRNELEVPAVPEDGC